MRIYLGGTNKIDISLGDCTIVTENFFKLVNFLKVSRKTIQGALSNEPIGNDYTVIHTDANLVGSAEVNSHFGLLGLGVAPRFLQKVRARPESATRGLRRFAAGQKP